MDGPHSTRLCRPSTASLVPIDPARGNRQRRLCQHRRVPRRHLLIHFALWSVALTQPVADLYGRNMTAFSAAKMAPLEIVAFVALLATAPTLFMSAVEVTAARVAPGSRRAIHLALVWPAVFLITLLVSNSVGFEFDPAVYPVCFGASFGVLWLYDRRPAVKTWMSWLSVLGIVATGTFVAQLWPLIVPPVPALADVAVRNVDTPVFVVIMDELPLYALLDENGNVNAERYPAFARLQREATWYPDTTAAANYTDQAVPAILASTWSDFAPYPTAAGYPRNLFTLLGGSMTMAATEPITSMCPASVCSKRVKAPSGFDPGRLSDFVLDAGAVYAQRLLPRHTRELLPSNNRRWTSFAMSEPSFVMTGGARRHLENIVEGATELAAEGGPQVRFVHSETPHFPWYVTPDRQIAINVPTFGRNSSVTGALRFYYQRMLYQLVAADAALGEAFAALDAAGVWDDALVVVSADHGISFISGQDQRASDLTNADQITDIYRVPLFVKFPGQSTGVRSDCAAATVDIVPTIVDVLDVDTNWTFDGGSLADGTCPVRSERVIHESGGKSSALRDGFESTLARLAYYSELVPASGDARAIARVGRSADLVGTSVDLDTLPASTVEVTWNLDGADVFDDVRPGRWERSPAIVTGAMWGTFPPGSELLVTVDGVVAGAADVGGVDGLSRLGVVLDYGIFTVPGASYTVELVLRDAAGRLSRIGPPNFSP